MGKTIVLRSLLFVVSLTLSQTLLAASCDYTIVSEWGSGFHAEVRITNDSAQAIDGWSVSWSYTDDADIQNAWNTQLSGEGPYVANNLSYNGRIAANASTTFGFIANKPTPGVAAQIPQLGGSCTGEEIPDNQAPVAQINANPSQGNIPLDVTFDGRGSSDADGDSLSYLWDFGNGVTSTNAVVSRNFDQTGNYPVSLTVNDGQQDSATVFTTIVANDAPEPVDPAEPTDPAGPTGYILDSANSSLYFVSTAQIHRIETHTFTDLYGSISNDGEATFGMNLSSVDTGIDLRNQRARDLLFEVANFSEAVANVPVDLANLAAQSLGSTETTSITATLDLHGVSAAIDTEVTITKLSDTKFMVKNVSPIVIDAEDFDLVRGVDALRNIANLLSISYAVPVNFTLLFDAAPAQ